MKVFQFDYKGKYTGVVLAKDRDEAMLKLYEYYNENRAVRLYLTITDATKSYYFNPEHPDVYCLHAIKEEI